MQRTVSALQIAAAARRASIRHAVDAATTSRAPREETSNTGSAPRNTHSSMPAYPSAWSDQQPVTKAHRRMEKTQLLVEKNKFLSIVYLSVILK